MAGSGFSMIVSNLTIGVIKDAQPKFSYPVACLEGLQPYGFVCFDRPKLDVHHNSRLLIWLLKCHMWRVWLRKTSKTILLFMFHFNQYGFPWAHLTALMRKSRRQDHASYRWACLFLACMAACGFVSVAWSRGPEAPRSFPNDSHSGSENQPLKTHMSKMTQPKITHTNPYLGKKTKKTLQKDHQAGILQRLSVVKTEPYKNTKKEKQQEKKHSKSNKEETTKKVKVNACQ